MEQVILEILDALRTKESLDDKELSRILHAANRTAVDEARRQGRKAETRPFVKKRLLPYVLKMQREHPEIWESWGADDALARRLFKTLQMKPRRTASGVATITVITPPWPCPGSCVFCPNDVRMPKSYLHDEPACQRAERNFFDPYLQVSARLHVLHEMGHPCDKVELIVLGGSWSAYPQAYQTWFVGELFAALNDGLESAARAEERRRFYESLGFGSAQEALAAQARDDQRLVSQGMLTYNEAFARRGAKSGFVEAVVERLCTDSGESRLAGLQHANESAGHRCVGLVIETRPDDITPQALVQLRSYGCTKVQIGVQSVDNLVLERNGRNMASADIRRSFELLRLFGFKIHAHFMVNLVGMTPEKDKLDYRRFMTDGAYLPDEVKLYPCALIEGSALCGLYECGEWEPYTQDQLVDVLCEDLLSTPPFTRVSRMIRDFTAADIVAGNKKTNLRQMVECRAESEGAVVQEIRFREINAADIEPDALELQDVAYETTSTFEHFLQWVTPQGKIAGFLRLSLPKQEALAAWNGSLPVRTGEAMIREVHVYGRAARIDEQGRAAQHRGLGRKLVERACAIALDEGFSAVNVISAVGTRGYYKKLGFRDGGLYQTRMLWPDRQRASAPAALTGPKRLATG